MTRASSAIGIKYRDGVILSTDTILNYGRLQIPFKSRLLVLNGTQFAFSGDMADIQFLTENLTKINEKFAEENFTKKENSKISFRNETEINKTVNYNTYHEEKGYSTWMFIRHIQKLLYGRRTENKPLKVDVIVAGKVSKEERELMAGENYTKMADSEIVLYSINERGNFFSSNVICTGLAHHILTPFLRKFFEDDKCKNLNENDALKIFIEALKVNFYRDCSSCDEVEVCVFNEKSNELKITKIKLEAEWDL